MRQEDKQEIEEAWMQVKRNQINKYQEAIRANRQIAAVLQTRGMNENAIYFAYRAQLLKQWILRQNLLQKHVQRDMSKVLLLLAIFCIIALFIALVWLQSNASQNNFCPPFHNYWWANQPICQHSGGQLFTIWMANLPQWLVLSTLMFLGGIFFLSLLGIPFFQDPQQGNQWQIYPTLGILLIGILLLVAPPLAILPSIILSLFDPHNLSHVLLNLAPFLTTCFCYILWRVVSRNIKRLKQPTGSISPILYILDFVLGFSVLFILIFLIGFIIVIWNYEYTILTIILQVCFPFLLYFIWKGLQYIQRIQNVKKDILSWAIEFLKTLATLHSRLFTLSLECFMAPMLNGMKHLW